MLFQFMLPKMAGSLYCWQLNNIDQKVQSYLMPSVYVLLFMYKVLPCIPSENNHKAVKIADSQFLKLLPFSSCLGIYPKNKQCHEHETRP